MRYSRFIVLVAVVFVACCNTATTAESSLGIKATSANSPHEVTDTNQGRRYLKGSKNEIIADEERAAPVGLNKLLGTIKVTNFQQFSKLPFLKQIAQIKSKYGTGVAKAFAKWRSAQLNLNYTDSLKPNEYLTFDKQNCKLLQKCKMPLPSCCQVCGPSATASPESLFKCSRCQSVLYCGREHQTEDFASHKATCRRIKKMREKMAQEEEIVRNSTEDFWTPANAFETHVGHFWGLRGTRPYMTAKLEVIRALSTIPSRPAIEAALAEAMDSMRLCRVDNLGIREVIPTLMLILDQYQEAYDFIKWYATTGDDDHYDWGNMDLPFLDVRNADMTEEIPGSMRNGRDVFFMSNLAYIKLMLAKTVKDAINAYNQGDRTSLPSIESLRAVVAPNGTMRSVTELKRLHKQLTSQMHAASSLAHFQNQHFWNGVLDPTPIVQAPKPPHYAPGDINQVKLWVLQSAMLWRDHHDFIREKRSAYPDYLPEMPQRGIQQLVTFP